jgi:gliding motility-associated-like protein
MKKLLLVTASLFLVPAAIQAQLIQSNGIAYYDTLQSSQAKIATAPLSPQNGNGSLGQIYNNSACGLNYVQSSVMIATRYFPPGVGSPATLNISGMPCNKTVDKAYVWWTTSGFTSSATITVTNPSGVPTTYTATLAGSGPAKCWSEIGTYTFRADVTSCITGNGNYTVNVSTGGYDTDGATLMIIYRDLSATYYGTLVINDGCVVNNIGGAVSQTMTGINACGSSSYANAFVIASDLQDNVAFTHTTTLNNTNLSFPQSFWNFDVSNTSVFAGQNTSGFGINISTDCYAMAVMGLYFQTTTCTTCTPTSAMSASFTQSNVTCFGGSNGSATVTPVGSVGPYSYSWAPFGGNSQTATGLSAGTYTCTISDGVACNTTQAVITITQPPAVTASQSQSNVSCFGGSNGSATVFAAGGNGSYSYSWLPAGGNGSTASGLAPGGYTCTITDGNGCSTTSAFSISQPSAVSTSSSQTNVSCSGGSNGTATVSPSGGTPGYTYLWSPSGGNLSTASGLSAGIYTCTINDANGCSTTQSFNISQPSPLSASMSSTNAGCAQSNGSATASPAGGTPGYTYSWSPSGGNLSTATGLAAGSYTCTINDANGCSTIGTVIVSTPPNTLSVQSNQTNVSCFGGSTGSATVSVSGGSPGYTYSWSPTGGNGATASGLSAGSYTCLITDAGGCTGQASFTIAQPAPLVPSAAVLDATCNSACDGALGAQVSGGSGSYTYSWSPGGQTTGTLSGLCAGSYTLSIIDGNGCSASNIFTINQPSPVTASVASVTQPSCSSSGGSITVAASGGTGTLNYAWSPSGGNTSTASNLPAGTYTCTITDANNCPATVTASISTPPNALAAQSSQSNVSCSGGNNGSATVNVSGGTPGYSYSWSSGGTNATETGLVQGTYTCNVTDANGCTTSASFTITAPTALSATSSAVDATCNAACNGSANVVVTGGTSGYSFMWMPGSITTQQATNLCAGTYTCTVTDANGCTFAQTAVVSEPVAVTGSVAASADVTCNGAANGSANITASGGTGTFSYLWSPSGGTTASATGLSGGTYLVTVTDNNNCASTVNVNINEPAALSLNITGNTSICTGDSSLITANVSGGTSPYIYAWSNGNTNASQYVIPSSSASYSVAVTDANGCTLPQQSITVNVSPPLVCSVSAGDSICAGDSVALSASAIGGNLPYSYTWSHGLGSGAGPKYVSPFVSTTYTCTVTDGCGNLYSGIVPVIVLPAPVAMFTPMPDSTFTDDPVMFIDNSTNATSWWWDFGDGDTSGVQNPIHAYHSTGEYVVTLVTANTYGCYDTLRYSFIDVMEGLEIPNVFSPNGDGVNDVFHVFSSGAEEYSFEVFDRWGLKIFDTTAPRIDWDGHTNAGQPATAGTYYYILYARMSSGKVYDLRGHITLLR